MPEVCLCVESCMPKLSSIKDFFGLHIGSVPSEFLPRIEVLLAHARTANSSAWLLGPLPHDIIVALPRIHRRIPASIVGVLVCTGIALAF